MRLLSLKPLRHLAVALALCLRLSFASGERQLVEFGYATLGYQLTPSYIATATIASDSNVSAPMDPMASR